VVGRINFALERLDSPRHSSHVAQLFSLGHITRHAHIPAKQARVVGSSAISVQGIHRNCAIFVFDFRPASSLSAFWCDLRRGDFDFWFDS